jgi:hypothetical protein
MKLLKDYSFVRGVCHGPHGQDPEIWKRDFGYMKRLNLNSIRMWMAQQAWEKDGAAYEKIIGDYFQEANNFGITIMPIFFNGNAISEFTPLTEEQWARAEKYTAAMIGVLKDQANLIMWDAINEPFCCDYLRTSPKEEYGQRWENIKYYTRRICEIILKLDRTSPLTVGHELVPHLESTLDLVDVVCFHDYRHTRAEMEDALVTSLKIAGAKPVMNSETGCVCRSNPYDIELELCAKYKIGFYIFNLIIEGTWADSHGIVYPDGEIRDPAVVAAVMGFFRKRGPGRVLANPNREQHAEAAIKRIEDILAVKTTHLHHFKLATLDEILEAAEYGVNILETAELTPMWYPPSAKLARFRAQTPEQRDPAEIKQFAWDIARQLKAACLL